MKRVAAPSTLPASPREPWIGVDELNFAEFPLTTIGDRPSGQRTLVFGDEIEDKGAGTRVQRKLAVSASDLYGLPTPRDSDVLLVLIDLTKSNNGFTKRTVQFRRSELLATLGWDDGGKSYQRLDESLQRWASVTLFYNGAWWDKSVKRWRSKTFHVLETVDLRGREQAGCPDDSLSSFTWNEVVFASFEAKNLRSLDLDLYFRLLRPTSRQAYRFLAKRFFLRSSLTLDLRVFLCEHVGFSRTYDNSQLKRKAQPMLAELEAVGFLAPMNDANRYQKVARGQWKIRLTKGREIKASESPSSLAEQKLVERGIRAKIAQVLAARYGEKRVLEKVRLHDWLRSRKDPRMSKSSAGFLVWAVREDFRPEDFLASERPSRQRAARVRNSGVAAAEISGPLAEGLAVWQALSAEEKVRVEREALAAADPVQHDSYRRLVGRRGALFIELRDSLVSRFLASTRLDAGPNAVESMVGQESAHEDEGCDGNHREPHCDNDAA